MAAITSDRDGLLALHERERQAHLTGDATLISDVFADEVWEAGRGQLSRLSREDLKRRFEAYFASVRYSVWDDLQPPHVSIADDGRHAWMAIHIEGRVTGIEDPSQERRFESAWIATYEKVGDRWLMVGISSSVVDRS